MRKELSPKEEKDLRRKENVSIAHGRVHGQYRENGKPRGGVERWKLKLRHVVILAGVSAGIVFTGAQAVGELFHSVNSDPTPQPTLPAGEPNGQVDTSEWIVK